MNIRKADHMALLVANVEHARDFYIRALGMQEIPRPKHFNFPGAWLSKGNFQIHLIGEQTKGRAKRVYPGYQTDELSLIRRSSRRKLTCEMNAFEDGLNAYPALP